MLNADRVGRVNMDTGLEAISRDRSDGKHAAWVSSIVANFKTHSAKIGIIGLGYVGLPLACTVARKGYPVLGFDIDTAKVDQINEGKSYIAHIDSSEVSQL